MSTIEELRRELEAEWMAQNTWLDYRNWLQSELLKSRQDSKAAYSQGYKDALKWIPVEERLPEGDSGHALIAYDKSGEKRVYVSFWWRSNDDSFQWNYDHVVKCVTHWMPLPDPPESGRSCTEAH